MPISILIKSNEQLPPWKKLREEAMDMNMVLAKSMPG